MKLLIRGGRVIDPAQELDVAADVLVEDGKIAAVGAPVGGVGGGSDPGDATIIEARGLVVSPGLIDMHVHLREPGREDEETIASGTRAAVAGGFTAVVSMPNTEPVTEGEEGVRFVLAKAREAEAARVHPVAAVTRGLMGEMLAEIGSAIHAGAVAVSDDGKPVANSGLMRRALEYTRMLGKPVISHSEDPALTGKGVMNEGRISTLLGLGGIPKESEEIAVGRDISLAGLTSGQLHIAHISTARSLELVLEAKRLGLKVTCEATPHHFTLTDEAVRTYDTNTKMSPPLRTAHDVGALRRGLKSGLVDAVASDHAPHALEEKDQEFDAAPFGIVGLETSLGLALTELHHKSGLPLADLVRLMSTNPARILGLPAGTLKVGAPADITIFDPDHQWTVDAARFLSRSRNTPFSGWQLRGKAVTVIVGGRLLMRDGEMLS
ncbi:MAG TPA: dihydroorotase [bacterium]|nr:dihydroorotase [bacterium]